MLVWSNNVIKQIWLEDIKEITFYPDNVNKRGVSIPYLYITYDGNKHDDTIISFHNIEEMENFVKLHIKVE